MSYEELYYIYVATFCSTTLAYSLAPVTVVLNNDGDNLTVRFSDYTNGTPIPIDSGGGRTIPTQTPNASGVCSFVVGEGDPDWGGISSTKVNSNVILDIYDGTTLVAQFRLDELIETTARTEQLPSNVIIGNELKVEGESKFVGDATFKGETKFEEPATFDDEAKFKGQVTVNGVLKLNSNEFSDAEGLGEIESNIMVYVGEGEDDFEESDFSNNLVNGATQTTYSRSSALLDDAGDYDCQITTACGVLLTSAKAKLDVFQAPKIATQPTGKSGCDGTPVTLTAVIEGEFTTLQWRKNGQPISGANNSTYVINSLKASDEGDYTLRVTSDKCGNEISSSIAKVVVNKEPKFVAQPKSISSCEGSEVKFTAQVDGSITGFQWYKDDTRITGATSREYKIEEVMATDAGNYKLEIIGACGTKLFSDIVTLSISSAPTIASQPSNKEVFVDESVTLSVIAENPGGDSKDLTYQWKKNGNNIANANTNAYTINKVALSDAAKYSVEVKNACNLLVNSTEANLIVLENNGGPAITTNISVLDFGDVKIGEMKTENSKLSISNSGDENLVITAINISGAESNAFTIASPALPVVIEPEFKIEISTNFKPTKVGLNQAMMTIVSNSVNNATIELRGNGIDNGTLTSTVSSLSFGSVVINEEVELKFDIENPTTKNITITGITASSSDFSFTVLTDPIIAPNTKREIVITFLPTVVRDYNELLTISTDDGNKLEIPLTASAILSSVWNGIPTINSIKSYPNPSEGSISLELNFYETQRYEVSIVDLKGIKQIEFNEYSTIGKNMVVWNGRDFSNTRVANGSYLAIIKVGKNVQTLRFVIQ